MDEENKVSQPYSLDPVIVAWANVKAGKLTAESGKRVSASAIVNDTLKRAMEQDLNEADFAHLRRMVKRNILKQK